MFTVRDREESFLRSIRGRSTLADHNLFWQSYLSKLLHEGKFRPEKLASLMNREMNLTGHLIKHGNKSNHNWTPFLESSWNALSQEAKNNFYRYGTLVNTTDEWKMKFLFISLGEDKTRDPVTSASFIRFDKSIRGSQEHKDYWNYVLFHQMSYAHKVIIEGYLEGNPDLVFLTDEFNYSELLKGLADGYTYRDNPDLYNWLMKFAVKYPAPLGSAKYHAKFKLVAATSPCLSETVRNDYKNQLTQMDFDINDFNMYFFPEQNWFEFAKMFPEHVETALDELLVKKREVPAGLRKFYLDNLKNYEIDNLYPAEWLPDELNVYLMFKHYVHEFTLPETEAMFLYFRRVLEAHYDMPVNFATKDALLNLIKASSAEKLLNMSA